MAPEALRIAPLLFLSGFCALVYQIAWLREFRLIFGASTAAQAAVLALFIGGLGLGGLVLGPRADRRRSPLAFYARLEALVALSTAATPWLLTLVRQVYLELGGTVVLGLGLGTLLRLLLTGIVIGVPTFLMGGTLPAAVRAAASDDDPRRRGVALLYGINTLGAVLGSLLATFLMLELFGTRQTLWLACLLNLLVSLVARDMARRSLPPPAAAAVATSDAPPAAPVGLVCAASAIVGFAFFLMETVWYRMLAPLLGGSVFTFGLILSIALLGIGAGSACSAWLARGRAATLRGFALTCGLEAACLALPLALGDGVAVLALFLRPLGNFGFAGHILGWSLVTALVVLPAAFVAGIQFPLLVSLLGQGRQRVGRQLGLIYAWNTAGAIAGSLAGGFGLMPVLGAVGCWRAVAGLLAALALASIAAAWRLEGQRASLLPQALLAAGVFAALAAPGPSAAWRHSGIGVGRAPGNALGGPGQLQDWLRRERRSVRWERDGVESSVALQTRLGMAFVVNGKVDGHATLDAPTQVMSGVLAALLHPAPRDVLVIGLGTGSSAGWLAAIPGIGHVDAVELESAMLQVAEACAAVNKDVLRNPKAEVVIGDAREILLATPKRYDIIFSEPSNPYRAGIASLFTREYYQAAADRLREHGLFVQWIQGYEISADAVQTAYATLGSVFPEVSTWRTHRDLLLVASRTPLVQSTPALRDRMREEPYREALSVAWRVSDLEGLLAHFVARPSLARDLARSHRGLQNTDDRNRLEFGFARAVGLRGLFDLADLRRLAQARGVGRPELTGPAPDWERVEDATLRLYADNDGAADTQPPDRRARLTAYQQHMAGDLAAAQATWRSQPRAPADAIELGLVAEGLAAAGDAAALPYVDQLRRLQPAEADAVLGRLELESGRPEDAARALEASFALHRSDPWPRVEVMARALETARRLAASQPELATRMFIALAQPFAGGSLDEERRFTSWDVAVSSGHGLLCARAATALEPFVPWRQDFLEQRAACYASVQHPLTAQAQRDLAEIRRSQPRPFGDGLKPERQ